MSFSWCHHQICERGQPIHREEERDADQRGDHRRKYRQRMAVDVVREAEYLYYEKGAGEANDEVEDLYELLAQIK